MRAWLNGLQNHPKTETFPRVTATTPRTEVYTPVTNQIVASLEQGVRPWLKPWNAGHAGHAAGRTTRPLRHNGLLYHGINILMLWASADLAGYACPYWLTFKQALELGGHVRKA